jgi:hypothetical protein
LALQQGFLSLTFSEPIMNHMLKVAAIAYVTVVIAKRLPVLKYYI